MASTQKELFTRVNFTYDTLSLATDNVIGAHTRVTEQERGRVGHLGSILRISYTNSYVDIVRRTAGA